MTDRPDRAAQSVVVRPVDGADHDAWEALWLAYLVFYEASLPAGHANVLWRRLIDPADPAEGLVAVVAGRVVGLVHFFPHPDTWEEGAACYMQDLFVDAANRGIGAGEALIEAVRTRAKEAGWAYVYWQTAEDNATARRLYDRLAGGRTRFVVYQIGTEE